MMQYPATREVITAGIKRRPDDEIGSFWEEINARHDGFVCCCAFCPAESRGRFRPFLKETLEKWHKKTKLEGQLLEI